MDHKVMDMTHTDTSLSDFLNQRDVGLRARLDLAIEHALEDRRIVGTVVLVAKGGDIVYGRAVGFATWRPAVRCRRTASSCSRRWQSRS